MGLNWHLYLNFVCISWIRPKRVWNLFTSKSFKKSKTLEGLHMWKRWFYLVMASSRSRCGPFCHILLCSENCWQTQGGRISTCILTKVVRVVFDILYNTKMLVHKIREIRLVYMVSQGYRIRCVLVVSLEKWTIFSSDLKTYGSWIHTHKISYNIVALHIHTDRLKQKSSNKSCYSLLSILYIFST